MNTSDNLFSNKVICDKCGEDLTGIGIIAYVDHPCFTQKITYKVYTDNEMRIAFMEIGIPNIGFEAMGYVKPTKMERIIYEQNKDGK